MWQKNHQYFLYIDAKLEFHKKKKINDKWERNKISLNQDIHFGYHVKAANLLVKCSFKSLSVKWAVCI